MLQSRTYFFTGPIGPAGIKFRQYNRPPEATFVDLFDSVLFKLESGDRAQLNANGHARIAKAADVVSRSISFIGVPTTFFTLPDHLPEVLTTATANHAVLSTSTANGMTVEKLSYSPGGILTRSDFKVKSDVTLSCSDNFVTVTEAPAGSKHFVLTANALYASAFMVMADTGATPGYLDAVSDPHHFVVTAHIFKLRYQNTQSISISDDAVGIKADINLDGTTLVIGAGGLSLKDPTTYVRTTGNQSITSGIKVFTVYPEILDPATAPTLDAQFTPKKYVDDLDALCVHKAGAETITGIKEFQLFPWKTGPGLSPTLAEQFTTKFYVDGLYATALGIWEWGTGANAIQSVNSWSGNNASGDESFCVGIDNTSSGLRSMCIGEDNTASDTHAMAMGYKCVANGQYAMAFGHTCTATGARSTTFGHMSSATGSDSFAAGYTCLAIGLSSTALGFQTLAIGNYSTSFGRDSIARANDSKADGIRSISHLIGSKAFANDRFHITGDAQTLEFILKKETTDATPANMLASNGVINGWLIPADCVMKVHVQLVAVNTDDNGGMGAAIGENMAQDIYFTVSNIAGISVISANTAATVADVQTVTADVTYILPQKTAGFTGSVQILLTINQLDIEVTGEASTTKQWVAFVKTVMTGFGTFAI